MKAKRLSALLCVVLAFAVCFAFAACGDDRPASATEYTVTFDANGGTLTGSSTVKVKSGESITGAPTASKTGVDFAGWYTAATEGTKVDISTYKVTANVTLYAHYVAPSAKVTFDANGGALKGDAVVSVDKNGNVIDCPTATYAGHRFKGWFTEKTGGTEINPMFDTIEQDTTLYAQWIKVWTVTFDANGGTIAGNNTVIVDDGNKLGNVPEATKDDLVLYGWYTAAEGGEKVDVANYSPISDVTLYARYGKLTMPLTILKSSDKTPAGYRIEAENARVTGKPSYGDSFINEGEAAGTASGGACLGSLSVAGNKIEFTFDAASAGKANISLWVSSNTMSGMSVVNQTVDTTVLTVTLNGNNVTYAPGVAPGSNAFSWNVKFGAIEFGELDVIEGFNTVIIEVKSDKMPNVDCLDVQTELTLTAVNGDAASGEALLPAPPVPYNKDVNVKLMVSAHAGNPIIDKAVIGLDDDIPAAAVSSLAEGKALFRLTAGGQSAFDTYLSDANGNAVAEGTDSSKYVTLEYKGYYNAAIYQWVPKPNAFAYNMATGRNNWQEVKVSLDTPLVLSETTYTSIGGNTVADWDIPALNGWDTTGTYTDPDKVTVGTGDDAEQKEITLKYASWTPTPVNGKNGKKPLVVWLHGAGEGGTDPRIALLGNQVTNLSTNLIQKYFVTDDIPGAYLLAPQSPTMWMDNGNGQQGGNDVGESIYTESLFKLIQKFVTEHADIDANRVYLGGCSNGGWMTVEMLSKHGEFFAAAYPIAVPYVKDAGMTAGEFNRLAAVPMWITHAKADRTVELGSWTPGQNWWDPATFNGFTETNSNSLYIELLKAGATNAHYSMFDTVAIAEGDVDAGTYDGHYSWIYVLRDECFKVQEKTGTGADNAFTLDDLKVGVEQTGTVKLTPDGDAVGLWAWLAGQSKTVAAA